MVFVIDAGHGGFVPAGRSSPIGAVGYSGTLEKNITLDVARQVAAHLGKSAQLTRRTDTNMSLVDRMCRLRNIPSAVFLSIHANAGSFDLVGTETWVHELATPASVALAHHLHRAIVGLGRPDRGVRRGPIALLHPSVLRASAVGCLVELDYLSNPDGERWLTSPPHRRRIAVRIAQALRTFAEAREFARLLGQKDGRMMPAPARDLARRERMFGAPHPSAAVASESHPRCRAPTLSHA